VNKITFHGIDRGGQANVQSWPGQSQSRVTIGVGRPKSPSLVFADANSPKSGWGRRLPCSESGRLASPRPRLPDRTVGLRQGRRPRSPEWPRPAAGQGRDANTMLGPLVSRSSRTGCCPTANRALAQGAKLVTGGKAPRRTGYFVKNHRIREHKPEMKIFQRRSSGRGCSASVQGRGTRPCASPTTAATAWPRTYGTRDIKRAHKHRRPLEGRLGAGSNCHGVVMTRRGGGLPFGGFKQSGWGRPRGFGGKSIDLHRDQDGCALLDD